MCVACSTSSPSRPIEVKGVDEPHRHLPGATRQAAHVPCRHTGHRGCRDPHGRARRRTRAVAGCIPLRVPRAETGSDHDRGRGRSRARAACCMSSKIGPRRSRRCFSSFADAPSRSPNCNPMGCCATCLPGACRSLDSDERRHGTRETCCRHRAAVGARRARPRPHVLGHVIGLDFSSSPHVHGLLDDAKQLRNRAFHAAAQTLRRMAEREARPRNARAGRLALGRRRLT